jgi:predicted RND superfamily exporter protein
MAGGSNHEAGPITRALENLIFGARPLVLLIFAAITVAMLFFASQLRVDAGFKKQIPLEHEYMKTFLDYEADFGGANRVLIAVVAKDGDMFDTSFFRTLEGVTRDVMAIEATDDARARSLFTPNVRFVEVVEDGFAGGNVIPDDFTPGVDGFEGSPEQFQTIRANIVKANIVGRLVAKDWSGAMVWADLIPEDSGTKLDYQAVAQQFEDIRSKYENDETTVHIIGFAKMVGDISDGAKSVIKFFLLTIAFTWLLLFLYSTSGKLATLTVLAAIISVIWMLGAIGFATILMIPIRIIFELAITATVGVAITILTDLILLPVLLSYTKLGNMERKREYRLRQLTRFDKIWALMSKFSKPVPAAIIILIGAAGWFFAERMGDRVMIGDAQEGVAELRPEARYNQDARMISTKFALGVDMVNVIAEARPDACTLSYPAMEMIDRFAWHLTNIEGVQQVITLPKMAKIVNSGWNDGSIKWRTLPRDSDSLRLATQGFETDSGLLNADCSAMPVTAFLADHRAETIDRVVAAVKDFREQNNAWHPGVNLREQLAAEQTKAMEAGEELQNDSVNLRLATGNVGVMAAINDTVRAVEHNILLMLYAAVFLMCLISFRSIFASLCIVLPLVLVTELGHSLMVELELGMKINTLTVVALGVGIGVDYAIYIYARMAEAMKAGKTLTESYFIALKTTGIAIFYTALTLAVGVAMWIFSELKFQADMGLMLTFMFVVNMFAALIFLPALCRWLLRPTEKDGWTPTV